MRRAIVLVGLVVLAACGGGGRARVPSDVDGLPARLAALDAALAAHGCQVHLRPGRPAAEIEEAARAAHVELPRELVVLWSWHDGEDRDDLGFVFRDQHLLSSADALAQLDEAALLAERDDHALVPFAGFEGALYTLPVARYDPRFERPVVGLGEEGPTIYFHSLARLVDTELAWLDDGRCDDPHYDRDRARELVPWRRINPGLF